jgi:hypothetical protein
MKVKRILIIQAQIFCFAFAKEELELLAKEATKEVRDLIKSGSVHGTTNRLVGNKAVIHQSCAYSAKVEFGRENWQIKNLISGMTFEIDEDDLESYISGDIEEVELWTFGKFDYSTILQENIEIKRGRKQQVSCFHGFSECNLWQGYPKSCFTTLSVDERMEVDGSLYATNIAQLTDAAGASKICFNIELQITRDDNSEKMRTVFKDTENGKDNLCATEPKAVFPGKPQISDFLETVRKEIVVEGLTLLGQKLQGRLGQRKCVNVGKSKTVPIRKNLHKSSGSCPHGFCHIVFSSYNQIFTFMWHMPMHNSP